MSIPHIPESIHRPSMDEVIIARRGLVLNAAQEKA